MSSVSLSLPMASKDAAIIMAKDSNWWHIYLFSPLSIRQSRKEAREEGRREGDTRDHMLEWWFKKCPKNITSSSSYSNLWLFIPFPDLYKDNGRNTFTLLSHNHFFPTPQTPCCNKYGYTCYIDFHSRYNLTVRQSSDWNSLMLVATEPGYPAITSWLNASFPVLT